MSAFGDITQSGSPSSYTVRLSRTGFPKDLSAGRSVRPGLYGRAMYRTCCRPGPHSSLLRAVIKIARRHRPLGPSTEKNISLYIPRYYVYIFDWD